MPTLSRHLWTTSIRYKCTVYLWLICNWLVVARLVVAHCFLLFQNFDHLFWIFLSALIYRNEVFVGRSTG